MRREPAKQSEPRRRGPTRQQQQAAPLSPPSLLLFPPGGRARVWIEKREESTRLPRAGRGQGSRTHTQGGVAPLGSREGRRWLFGRRGVEAAEAVALWEGPLQRSDGGEQGQAVGCLLEARALWAGSPPSRAGGRAGPRRGQTCGSAVIVPALPFTSDSKRPATARGIKTTSVWRDCPTQPRASRGAPATMGRAGARAGGRACCAVRGRAGRDVEGRAPLRGKPSRARSTRSRHQCSNIWQLRKRSMKLRVGSVRSLSFVYLHSNSAITRHHGTARA